MRESVFQSEFAKAVRGLSGAFYCKIPDAAASYAGPRSRFTPAKPFDALCVICGHSFAFEFKMVRWPGRLAFDSLRPNQAAGLQEFEVAGGNSFVVVNFRGKGRPKDSPEIVRRGRVNQTVVIPWAQWRELSVAGEKSVSFETLQKAQLVCVMHGVEAEKTLEFIATMAARTGRAYVAYVRNAVSGLPLSMTYTVNATSFNWPQAQKE